MIRTATETGSPPADRPPRVSFRTRLTLALLFTAIVPLVVFGAVVLIFEAILTGRPVDTTFAQLLLFALAILLASINVAGGFLVTQRMLRMVRT